ncbi:acylneuraminate cytidylyltransferase, partial [Fusobacterium simiae]|nr:acylneuraminate cytidylyltransferase [Fusobacterium simiae]
PSVAFRIDIKKEEIFLLNKIVKKNLKKEVSYILTNPFLVDDFGNLKLEYTYDGLHFTEKGYRKLKEILEKEIKL